MPTAFRRAFSQDAWERLLALGSRLRLAPGTFLLHRGDPPGPIYVILEGELEILDPRTSPPTVIDSVGPGEPLGDLSYLTGRPATADVRVVQEGRCVRLDRQDLDESLRDFPDLDAALHRGLSNTLARRLGRVTSSAMAGAFSGGPVTVSPDDDDEHDGDPYLASLLRQREPIAHLLVPGERLTLGRSPSCDLVLDDPRVASVHAEIVDVQGEGFRIVATGGQAVQVDGSWTVAAPLHEGDVIGLGRTRLRLQEGALLELPRPEPFALHVEGVHRTIGKTPILRDISFTALSGEVVAMIGPSGAGKSTLLRILSGHVLPDQGEVRLGSEPLAEVVLKHPATTSEVPQDDIVLPELSVAESLAFATRLRAPDADVEHVVNNIIADLSLEDVRRSRIGDPERRGISGGQRKRVNIGTELVSEDTRVLFLDEPTSGLDPRSTLDIARLARRLADDGRVVIIVTHDLDPALLAETDQLLVLTQGGRLAWFGPTEAACTRFGVPVPSRIFDRLPDRTPQAWAEAYARSPMASAFAARNAGSPLLDHPVLEGVAARIGWWRQLRVLVRRVAEVKRRDATSVSVLVLQPLLVAAVMLLVFPRGTSGLFFLLVLSCFWFGMSASVRELIADRVVWMRERRLGLSPSAWVLSKAIVVGTVVAVQAGLLSAAAHLGVGLWALDVSLPALAGVAVVTGWVGVGTGLLVSAVWRRSEAAVGTIVLWLVPQIAFSGLLMPLTDVSPVAWGLSWLTPVRYAFHLALQTGSELQYLKLGAWHARPVSGELFLMGLRPGGPGELGLSPGILIAVLVGLVIVQLAATIGVVARR